MAHCLSQVLLSDPQTLGAWGLYPDDERTQIPFPPGPLMDSLAKAETEPSALRGTGKSPAVSSDHGLGKWGEM